MATPPESFRPPESPPVPPRSSNLLSILLLVICLIILLSVLVIWGGVRFLEHGVKIHSGGGENSKEVSISTPFGGLEVHKNAGVSEASLGLPIYPGARPAKDQDSASVSLNFPGDHSLHIVAGKFDTPDSLEKVRSSYETRLTAQQGAFTKEAHLHLDTKNYDLDSGEMGNFLGEDKDGKTVFKMKQKGEEKVVALTSRDGGTRIEMVRVSKNAGAAN